MLCSVVTDFNFIATLHFLVFTEPQCLDEEQRVKLAAETILLSLLLFLVTIMNPLLIIGIFILGAGVGGLCILLQQRGLRAKFSNEIEDKLDRALFEPLRRKRVRSD
jgi:hypothetical protein